MVKLRIRDAELLAGTLFVIIGIWTSLGWLTLVPMGDGSYDASHYWHDPHGLIHPAWPWGFALWLGPAVIIASLIFLVWFFTEVIELDFENPFDRMH